MGTLAAGTYAVPATIRLVGILSGQVVKNPARVASENNVADLTRNQVFRENAPTLATCVGRVTRPLK